MIPSLNYVQYMNHLINSMSQIHLEIQMITDRLVFYCFGYPMPIRPLNISIALFLTIIAMSFLYIFHYRRLQPVSTGGTEFQYLGRKWAAFNQDWWYG